MKNKDNKGNKIIGNPTMINTKVEFEGENNIFYCEENITIKNSHLKFRGSNSIIYLSKNSHIYMLNITVHHQCSFYMGKNNYINDSLNVVISEGKNVFIGNDGLFSFGIWIRTADPHLIYDVHTNQRINDSKSVFIGDHVWLGQSTLILKGTKIASGSIIAAGGVVSGKTVLSNAIFGGNPGRYLRKNIYWDETCSHYFTKKETNAHKKLRNKQFIYKESAQEYIPFSTIDGDLLNVKTANEKLKIIMELEHNKNRFAINKIKHDPLKGPKKILKKIKKKIKKIMIEV